MCAAEVEAKKRYRRPSGSKSEYSVRRTVNRRLAAFQQIIATDNSICSVKEILLFLEELIDVCNFEVG
jgi:hypothetical protein